MRSMCTAASLFTACLWSTIHQASAFLGAVASITTLYDYNTRRYHVDASMGTGNTGIKLLMSPSVVIRGGGSCGSPAAAAAAADGDGSTVGDIVASETTVAAETAEDATETEDDEAEDDGEPFPIWSGMTAFEEGQAEAPAAGVIIVDPFCDYLGIKCEKRLTDAGYAVVKVLSEHMLCVVMKGTGAEIFRAPTAGREAEWVACLPFPPVAVLCESDAGLATAERLQAALLGPRFGGINEARRDKFLMNEALREAGLNAVRQVKTGKWSEARDFLSSLRRSPRSSPSPLPSFSSPPTSSTSPSASTGDTTSNQHRESTDQVPNTPSSATTNERGSGRIGAGILDSSECGDVMSVVKPARGCASGSVFLCRGETEAEEAFRKILGAPKYGTPGAVNEEVVVQEFLAGTEYVVDTVSRDGEHKIMAIWKYDKRPANGAPFVYFATKLRASDGEAEQKIIQYARAALDALGVKFGPTHTEVMMVDRQQGYGSDDNRSSGGTPFLVEVNTRWHLTDFAPVTDVCVGYNAVDETVSAYIDPERFDALPSVPPTGKGVKHGMVVHLVSYVSGKLEGIDHEEEIRNLESFAGMDVYADPERGGTGEVKKTIDIRSDAGWVHLVHENLDVLDEDFKRVVQFMPTMYRVSSSEDGGSHDRA